MNPTPKELEVLTELGQGKVAKQIADSLHKSIETVRVQIKSLKLKFNTGTDHGLVAEGFRRNILREPNNEDPTCNLPQTISKTLSK